MHLRIRFYFLLLAAAELSAIPTVLYGTINGVIGVVASLPHATYQLLESLQVSCTFRAERHARVFAASESWKRLLGQQLYRAGTGCATAVSQRAQEL